MAVDDVIVRAGPVAVPLDYKVPTGTEIIPRAVSARFDGTSAAGAFVPVLEVIAPNGSVTAYCARRLSYAAGASVLVSWFPGVAEADDDSQVSAAVGTIAELVSPLGTLAVSESQGPTTGVDMPTTGVVAGTYGDASHSSAVTVDAEGRITVASNVAIAGGSGTIGFEIGYDQITSTVSITSTTEATGTTIIACAAHVFDGAPVLVEFFTPTLDLPATAGFFVVVSLFEGATQIGELAVAENPVGGATSLSYPVIGKLRFTPSAASHTYTVTAYKSGAGLTHVQAGAGGTAAEVPAYIRFTKV